MIDEPGRASHHRDGSEPRPVSIGTSDADAAIGADGAMAIDCDQCVMQHTSTCDDCVVTFICSREPDEAVIVDVDEWRAVRLLQDAGMVPGLRHRRRIS